MDAVRPWLFVGKLAETLDYQRLLAHRIDAMLQLADEVAQPGIAHLYLDIQDGMPLAPEIIQAGVDFLVMHEALGHSVLVACGLGMSRAPTFAIAALCALEDLDPLAAYADVVRVRPIVRPHPALWRSLCAWRGVDIPYKEALKLSRE